MGTKMQQVMVPKPPLALTARGAKDAEGLLGTDPESPLRNGLWVQALAAIKDRGKTIHIYLYSVDSSKTFKIERTGVQYVRYKCSNDTNLSTHKINDDILVRCGEFTIVDKSSSIEVYYVADVLKIVNALEQKKDISKYLVARFPVPDPRTIVGW